MAVGRLMSAATTLVVALPLPLPQVTTAAVSMQSEACAVLLLCRVPADRF